MGTHIIFRHVTRPEDIEGSMLIDEEEYTECIGMAYFSACTMSRQKAAYGIDYMDCLTYGDGMIGPPEGDDYHGWFSPDWPQAVVKADRLFAAWEATDNEHRKEYDADKLGPFIELIRKCASHPDSKNCQVSIND